MDLVIYLQFDELIKLFSFTKTGLSSAMFYKKKSELLQFPSINMQIFSKDVTGDFDNSIHNRIFNAALQSSMHRRIQLNHEMRNLW